MTDHKSTATVMLAFFSVMASFLAFILLVPDKTLVHWLGFMFILLAEFVFFIGNLFIQMLMPRTNHPLTKRLLAAYLFFTIVVSVLFMLLIDAPVKVMVIIQVTLLVLTLIGIYVVGARGTAIEDKK